MKKVILFFNFFLFLSLSVFFFNNCSGAASRKAEILRSFSSNLETAPLPEPPKDPEEAEEKIEQLLNEEDSENVSAEEAAPEPKKPDTLTYFPYDLEFDTIALLNCESPSFFTFKAGAYFERSGIRLSEYFLKKKAEISESDLKALIESSFNYEAVPVFFLLPRHNVTTNGLKQEMSSFKLSRFIDELINTGSSRLRELDGELLEASLNPTTELQQTYRSTLMNKNNKYHLGIYYRLLKEGGGVIHQKGGDKGIDFYGRGYKTVLKDRGNFRHHIESISETKYPKKEHPAQKGWACPESLRFEIRRHPDRAWKAQAYYDQQNSEYKKKYPTLGAALNAEPAYKIEPDELLCPEGNPGSGVALTVAKKVLGDAWHININKKCIRPKTNTNRCYSQPFHRLADTKCLEDTTKNSCPALAEKVSCMTNPSTPGGWINYSYCPQYFSICIRKN